LTGLLLSDIERLIKKLKEEFPDIIKVGSIGNSYEKRPIHYILVDARVYLVTKHYAK
jgi:hypothetical protein